MNMAQYGQKIKGKTVCLVGFGVSHRDLVSFYLDLLAKVVVCDKRQRENFPEARALEALGVTLHLGQDYLDHVDGDYIFRTPGLSFYTPALTKARVAGQVVTSELETFFDLCPCPIIGVTGSDGKTTTTSLIAKMLELAGHRVHLGGNIGFPLLPRINQIEMDHWVVVELSSFQLISMRCSPMVAVVTNLAPNHLDAHADMAEYVDAKRNIFLHQHGGSRTVLNGDNEITRSFLPGVRDEPLVFSLAGEKPEKGAYLAKNGWLTMVWEGEEVPLFHQNIIKMPGKHNVDNLLAAISALWNIVPLWVFEEVAKRFAGVEHRIEFVRRIGGVSWYNDAIATSPTRTLAALAAFEGRVILLAGGYDKQIPYAPLAPAICQKVKTLYLMGATADKIQAAVLADPAFDPSLIEIKRVADLEQAVCLAHGAAGDGDVVILSPASASFDAYRNFEEKGQRFKTLVCALEEGKGENE